MANRTEIQTAMGNGSGARAVAMHVAGTVETDLYVDGDDGDDANDGTTGNPVQSLTRLCELLGPRLTSLVTVHFEPSATPYDLDELIDLPEIERWLVFDGGDNYEEVVPEVAVTGHTGRAVDCSGAAPGWTADAYVGLHAELIESDDSVLGRGTIGLNDSDSLEILCAKETDLGASSTVRIVRPSVKFRSSSFVGEGANGPLSVVIKGGPRRYGLGRAYGGLLWKNIELVADAGDSPRYQFTGSHAFIGTVFSGNNGYGQIPVFIDACVWSGLHELGDRIMFPELGISADEQAGWGLSFHDGSSVTRRGFVKLINSFFNGSVVSSAVESTHGSSVDLNNGVRLTGGPGYNNDNGVDQYYGYCLIAADGGEVNLRNRASAANGDDLIMLGGEDDHAIYCGAGSNVNIESGTTIQLAGTGTHFVLARNGGVVYIWDVTVSRLTSEDIDLHAWYGGNIRLTSGGGTDFSWIDNAYAGYQLGLNKTSSWLSGDSTNDEASTFDELPVDGGHIYRTS